MVCVAILALASPRAHAFIPTDGLGGVTGGFGFTHQRITETAVRGLYQEFFNTTRQTKGMRKALDQVVAANAAVDGNQGNSALHFDNENFGGGQRVIEDHAAHILSALNNDDAEGARQELGAALHTIQDFYAHSTWVEGNGGTTNPILGTPGARLDLINDDVTCTSCVPCIDCETNIEGWGLTSGYYGGEAPPNPGNKCRHGGPTDSGPGPSGGINKDSDQCLLSPHCSFHQAAAVAAIADTQRFIRSIKERISYKQLKHLFGVGATLGAAIDTTGSMEGKTQGFVAEVIRVLDTLIGTDDEPLKYVLSAFNDPQVGPVMITDDPDAFKAALAGVPAEEGGDCPEYSMSGILNAVAASDEGSNVYLLTDASSKDAGLAGAVASMAEKKRIKVHMGLSGRCSPIDPAYLMLAKRTGGQFLYLAWDEPGQISQFMSSTLISSPADVLFVSDTLAGDEKVYTVPVDSTLTSITFSVSVVDLDAPFDNAPAVVLTRPDGTVVGESDPGVQFTGLATSVVYTIGNPPDGTWTLSVSGTGQLSARVFGPSDLLFDEFAFVRAEGRDGHQGLFALRGAPAPGITETASATLSGVFTAVGVELRTEGGAPLTTLDLEPEAAGDAGKLYGEVTVPTSPFVAYATGTDANGVTFQRVVPRLITPQSVELSSPTAPPALAAGATTSYVFTVKNTGPADTFRFAALDGDGFPLSASAATIDLATGATAQVTVSVTVPADAQPGTADRLVVTVESTTDTSVRNSAVVAMTVLGAGGPLVVPPKVRDITATDLTLEWTAPFFDVASYSVERGTSSSGPWGPVASGITGRTVSDASGLTANTTYYYRLAAVQPDGTTVWSTPRSVTTSSPAPGRPTFPYVRTWYLEADWTEAAGALTYKLERAPDVSGAPGAFAQVGLATSFLHQWDDVEANTAYWYRVRAWNGVSDGPASDSSIVMTPPNTPGPLVFGAAPIR